MPSTSGVKLAVSVPAPSRTVVEVGGRASRTQAKLAPGLAGSVRPQGDGVVLTHGVAGLTGGVMVGLLANPDMLMYIGTEKDAPGVSVTGLLYGNPSQLWIQVAGAAFIIVYNAIATFIILKVIGFIVPLRMDEATLKVGDDAVHGETAYAIGAEGE